MTTGKDLVRAPRIPWSGALRRWALALLLASPAVVAPPAAQAQEPDTATAHPDTVPEAELPADTLPPESPPADTIPSDTIPTDTIPSDTIPADSIPADTIPSDSAVAAADTLPPVENLPALPSGEPAGPETAVWEWDREELLANRALTLSQLLEQVPGVLALRGGDFGTPRTVSAHGSAGGGVRVYRDGVEMVPLEGSVPDLARIGLGALERVRVFRTGWGVRIELETVRPDDPRPYSLVEAGTGALDTNLFRGAFTHPRALGGNVALSLDRIDTSGRDREEPGSISSVWLRYSYLHGDRLGLVAEFNRSTEDRDTLYAPSEATRTDWTLRGRARLTEGVVADAFWSSSSLKTGDDEDGGTAGDGTSFPFRAGSRSQLGVRLSAERGPFFGRAAFRAFSGRGLADDRLSVRAGAADEEIGGVAASWSRESWGRRQASRTTIRGWTRDFYGASAFASVDDYTRAVPFLPPLPPDTAQGTEGEGDGEPDAGADDSIGGLLSGALFTEGRSRRFGARYRWRGLELTGARLLEEADGLHPFGLPMDRNGFSLPAGPERRGWEAIFRIPLPMEGLSLAGSGQLWETPGAPDSLAVPDSLQAPDSEETGEVPGRPYLPRRSWKASLNYHNTFLPTENLEIWADVGLVARDSMRVPLPADFDREEDEGPAPVVEKPADAVAVVPEYRNWYARLQIRVVTVRIFITWENFIVADENQDFPGRRLPATRTLYGVRWTLWN